MYVYILMVLAFYTIHACTCIHPPGGHRVARDVPDPRHLAAHRAHSARGARAALRGAPRAVARGALGRRALAALLLLPLDAAAQAGRRRRIRETRDGNGNGTAVASCPMSVDGTVFLSTTALTGRPRSADNRPSVPSALIASIGAGPWSTRSRLHASRGTTALSLSDDHRVGGGVTV